MVIRKKRRPAAPALQRRPYTSIKTSRIPLRREEDLAAMLDCARKQDSGDVARRGVRGDRFSDSYMMATNGGSTYEDLLRPTPSVPVLPPPPSSSTPPKSNGYGQQAMHNVFGTDDRRVVEDTSRIPARSMGILKITLARGGTRWGTAWLIGPRALATAAHNLIHPDDGPAIQLHVGLAYDGTNARGGWHPIVDNALSQEWKNNPSDANPFDFAVLRIDNAEIGNKLGWFGMADYLDAKFDNMLVNLFGYPLDVAQKYHLYGVAGRVGNVSNDRIFYDCDAGGGMSGGPVIARFGEQRIAVGIHIAGGMNSNAATRLQGTVYEFFRERQSW